ncbi:ankyrin repeat-containing domain protein [Chytridium lagenaria]|nr:ankyrin repeat-containing domain protein [Chytridium lagenaria]
MDQACARGHLEVLRYLHDNRKEGCTKTAMDRAAANGHLDVVKFLHNERNEGCSKRAMNRAAAGGHIDVVKFLHEFREEGCTPDAIDHASRESLEVVQFLFKNRHEGCTAVAILEAVDGGKLDVVKYLYENHQDSFPLETMNSAFTSACLGGHLDIVKYLHGLDIILNVGPAALDMAARNGHLHVVKFLHTNRADGATTQALYMAIQMASSMNNSLNDTIKMDRINREQGMNISIGNLPAGNFIEGRREKFVNAFGVVQFLLENRNEGFTQECLEQVRACKEPLRTEALALFEQHMSKLRPGF